MSHDTDKLIRQLSLVAFLMAERRPLTARDIKSNVEGYQEMSDEAFARRFYSDRAELVALGVPLDSQRDEFTGEELYTLRSERYFLPELELDDEELAALQTCFYLLEGRFAYAEPLRLALQNLALGRSAGALAAAPTGTAVRVEVRDPDYSPELQGRLGKLEGAISKQRTVKFRYWSIYRDHEEERTLNPYALLPENGSWYVIGNDLDRGGQRRGCTSRRDLDEPPAQRAEAPARLALLEASLPAQIVQGNDLCLRSGASSVSEKAIHVVGHLNVCSVSERNDTPASRSRDRSFRMLRSLVISEAGCRSPLRSARRPRR